MMEGVGVIKRSFERAPSYSKKVDYGKSGWIDESLANIIKRRPYFIEDRITMTMAEMTKAADMAVRGSSTAGSASGQVNIFKVSTMNEFLHLSAR